MNKVHFSSAAVSYAALATLLAGCGGSQPPIGAPGAIPQNSATQPKVGRAASGALIYATGGCGGICVLSYPKGKVIASINVSKGAGGPCSDNAGNVFVPSDGTILEYQHGGTSPIATLTIPGSAPLGYSCSVDATTNNLAVTFLAASGDYVAIFDNESGSPTVYSSGIDSFFCGYDNAGNLFASGQSNNQPALSELAYGHSKFTPLTISGKLGLAGQVQWDGAYLTYESLGIDREAGSISRLTVSGSVATVVSTIPLNGKSNLTTLSWTYHGRVLVPYSTRGVRINKIGVWSYPQGGMRKSAIKFLNARFWAFQGVTVSVAPSH